MTRVLKALIGLGLCAAATTIIVAFPDPSARFPAELVRVLGADVLLLWVLGFTLILAAFV